MESKKFKVLVVEDAKFQQKIMMMTLEELSCEVDVAATGAQAVELISKNNYDIIFMDLGLEDTDGLTVTETIRSMESGKKHTPIIAVTAHAEDEIKNRCFQVGMDDFANKPITIELAKMMLEKYVSKKNV